MHLLLIHQAFTTLKGAGGTRHYELADHLVNDGHNVTVIASDVDYLAGRVIDEGEEPGDSRIRVDRVRITRRFHSSFFTRLLGYSIFMVKSFISAATVRNVDIVMGTSPPLFQGISAFLVAKLKRKPFVFEVRDLWPDFVIQIGALTNPILIFLARMVERSLYRTADALIINSPGFRQHLVECGANENDIFLVSNGVEAAMFDPESRGEQFREENNLDGCFVVLYAGAIGISNDIGVLLDAAEILSKENDIKVVLVGAGNELEKMKEYAEIKALRNVEFLPPVSKDEIPAVISAADVCVAILKGIPMFKTTYPNKVFDYMAAARPIILAIDGVIREVVEEADAGVFVQPGNSVEIAEAVMSFYKNREEAERMGKNGRHYVERNLSRQKQASYFEEILKQVCSLR